MLLFSLCNVWYGSAAAVGMLLSLQMTFVQALTGGGGWPMSVWLTPELTPFYGGTYYPGRDSYGMPSFPTVLRRIAHLWDTKRDDLREQVQHATK